MKALPDVAFGVSVLLPIFLRQIAARDIILLRRALESVLDQAYPGAVEVLLVDDGSAEPVEGFSDRLGAAANHIRWVRHPRNRGLVHALNSGLRHARQQFIARMDADDEWLPGKIEKQLALFAADDDLTIAGTGMERVTATGELIDQHIRPGDWSPLLHFMYDVGCPFPHGSVVARTAILRLLGGYPHDATFIHCEDFALWGTWLRFFKPAMVEEVLYRYTMGQGSVSGVYAEQQARASGIVHQRFRELQVAEKLPGALTELAEALGISLTDAGKFAYTMWHYGAAVLLPQIAIGPLAAILPDRNLIPASREKRVIDPTQILGLQNGMATDSASAFVACPI